MPASWISHLTATVNVTNLTNSTNTAVSWEVNGTVGGNASVGTIVPSTSDNHVGIYTAPAVVPSEGNEQVDVTAIAQQDSANPAPSLCNGRYFN